MCRRCYATVSPNETASVMEAFDNDKHNLCWSCAKEVWQEQLQDQTLSDVVQDGPCAGEP